MKRFLLLLLLPLLQAATITLPDKTINCGGANPCSTTALSNAVVIDTATARFVDCSAATNGGGTVASPFNSLSSVSSGSKFTGMDVWIKNGTTCTHQSLNVTWAGTSGDRVIVGAYYLVGGVAYAGLTNSGNLTPYGTESIGSRPIVTGTWNSSCRPDCDYNVSTAIPTSNNGGVFQAQNDYVTVQDIVVRDSAGYCFSSDAPGTYSSPTQWHTIFQRNVCDHSAGSGFGILDQDRGIIRDNLVHHTNLNYADRLDLTDWGDGIICTRGSFCLIEHNYVHDTWGEGIGNYRSQRSITRGNYVANTRRVGIYVAGQYKAIVEQNIVAGGQVDHGAGECNVSRCAYATTNWFPDGITVQLEESTQHSFVTNAGRLNLVRNNLIANMRGSGCLPYGSNPSNLTLFWISGKSIGNTCVMPVDQKWFKLGTTDIGLVESTEKIEVAMNLFAGGSTVTNCDVPSGYSSVFTARYNGHTYAYSDSDCVGTGDVISTSTGLGGFSFTSADKSNFPTYVDFIPSGGSFATSGLSMTSTYLTLADYPQKADFQWQPCGNSNLSDANWAKLLYADYCNNTRSASPTMGALNAQ